MEDELSLEERVSRLEKLVGELKGNSAAPGGQAASTGRPQPRVRATNPLAAKSLEWWLARGGAILTSLALILLYQYAVERNWITPIVRVAAGIAVGAALIYCAVRFTTRDSKTDQVGLREVLLGAGLAAWYISAYAAAVFYQLIPVSGARLVFLGLTIAGAWIALSEHRSVLGLLALGVGFLTPVLLPTPSPNIPVFAFYLGALTAVGVVLYLMRGWLSIVWLTFIAFWWTAGESTNVLSGQIDRFAISLLVILAGAAMVRTPLLRRRLVASGSPLYTEPVRSSNTESVVRAFASLVETFSRVPVSLDSPALWVITILSPLLSVLVLSWSWTSVQGSIWGILSLAIAAVVYRFAASSRESEELTHIEATAAVVWSLAGTLWIADAAGTRAREAGALMLFAAAFHSFVTVFYLRSSQFVGARKIGFVTAAACLVVAVMWELVAQATHPFGFEAWWTAAEAATIATCIWIWWNYRKTPEPSSFAALLGIVAYVAILLMDARVLGRIWPPLVTASFAIAGTALLISGRARKEDAIVRRIGGLTLAIVVFRLFMIDLAGVETIWRVLLFMGCGALFLFTSHRLQRAQAEQ